MPFLSQQVVHTHLRTERHHQKNDGPGKTGEYVGTSRFSNPELSSVEEAVRSETLGDVTPVSGFSICQGKKPINPFLINTC